MTTLNDSKKLANGINEYKLLFAAIQNAEKSDYSRQEVRDIIVHINDLLLGNGKVGDYKEKLPFIK